MVATLDLSTPREPTSSPNPRPRTGQESHARHHAGPEGPHSPRFDRRHGSAMHPSRCFRPTSAIHISKTSTQTRLGYGRNAAVGATVHAAPPASPGCPPAGGVSSTPTVSKRPSSDAAVATRAAALLPRHEPPQPPFPPCREARWFRRPATPSNTEPLSRAASPSRLLRRSGSATPLRRRRSPGNG